MMSFFSFFFLKLERNERFFFFDLASMLNIDPDSDPEQSSTIEAVLLSRPIEGLARLFMLAVLSEVTICGGGAIKWLSDELLETAVAAMAAAADMEPPAS